MAESSSDKKPRKSRIEILRDKRAELEEQIKKLALQEKEREKQAALREKAQERKKDDRRKIIVGAMALTHMEQNPDSEFTRTLKHLIQTYAKPYDRPLFDFLEDNGTAANDDFRNAASAKETS